MIIILLCLIIHVSQPCSNIYILYHKKLVHHYIHGVSGTAALHCSFCATPQQNTRTQINRQPGGDLHVVANLSLWRQMLSYFFQGLF